MTAILVLYADKTMYSDAEKYDQESNVQLYMCIQLSVLFLIVGYTYIHSYEIRTKYTQHINNLIYIEKLVLRYLKITATKLIQT